MSGPKTTPPESTFAAKDVAVEMARWLAHLRTERRMSGKTVEAYERDARQFLLFIAEHLGGAPSLRELAALAPQDVRAFMAARRAEDISGRSLMRGLAGMRSFARFLERNGKGKVGALAAVRAPKVKLLPTNRMVRAKAGVANSDRIAIRPAKGFIRFLTTMPPKPPPPSPHRPGS